MDSDQVDEARILETVGRVLRGEVAAFEIIIKAYQGIVFRICRSVLSNREDAEDAAQESFCRAFRLLRTFRLDKRFKPWIVSIALNTSRSFYRKRGRISANTSPVAPEEVQSSSSVEIEGERAILKESIRAAVQRLPARLRDTVILYYLEEFDVSDVAAALNIGKENVKSRLHRARGVLREILEKSATERSDNE